jgi:hypothetical protein
MSTQWPFGNGQASTLSGTVEFQATFRDYEGTRAVTRFWFLTDEPTEIQTYADTLLYNLSGLTHAQIEGYTLTYRFGWNPGVGSSGGKYPQASAKARMLFGWSAHSSPLELNLPAPQDALLEADLETVAGVWGGAIATALANCEGLTVASGNIAGGGQVYLAGYVVKSARRPRSRGYSQETGGDD